MEHPFDRLSRTLGETKSRRSLLKHAGVGAVSVLVASLLPRGLRRAEATPCAPGLVSCGGTCTDLLSDSANCGGCGVSAGPGGSCVNGVVVQPSGGGSSSSSTSSASGAPTSNGGTGPSSSAIELTPNLFTPDPPSYLPGVGASCFTSGGCQPQLTCCRGTGVNAGNALVGLGVCTMLGTRSDCRFCGDLCLPFDICCPSGCTDTSTDSANCGSCDKKCPAGTTCVNGGCTCTATSCGAGCCYQGQCVAAGSACGTCTICQGGTCRTCDQAGLQCQNGVCVQSCAQHPCTTGSCAQSGTCIADGLGNPNNCGPTGGTCIPCGANEDCVNGSCTCKAGTTKCGASCCATGQTCTNGQCSTGCPPLFFVGGTCCLPSAAACAAVGPNCTVGTVCAGRLVGCCPAGATCTLGVCSVDICSPATCTTCCYKGQCLSIGQLVPAEGGSACGANGGACTFCPAGLICGPGGVCACNTPGWAVCGSGSARQCCAPASCINGACCHTIVCGDTCCAQGESCQTCSTNTKSTSLCCPAGNTICNGVCTPGSRCDANNFCIP